MARPIHGSHVDAVYMEIREAILDLRYPPGMALRLKALEASHGGSIIPIREALRRLESERLVAMVPNKGARVSGISLADLDDAFSTRVVVEVAALRRASARMTPDDAKVLRNLAGEMNTRFGVGDRRAGLEAHQQFHFAIYELSGSDWLMHLIKALWNHTERYRRIATQQRSTLDIAEEHASILETLERFDTEAACEALTRHLQRTAEVTREGYRILEETDTFSTDGSSVMT